MWRCVDEWLEEWPQETEFLEFNLSVLLFRSIFGQIMAEYNPEHKDIQVLSSTDYKILSILVSIECSNGWAWW